MSRLLISLLFIAGVAVSGEALPLKRVKNWSLAGKFEKPVNAKDVTAIVISAQMRRFHKNSNSFSDGAVPVKFTIVDEQTFRIQSARVMGDPEGIYSIGIYYNGNVGTLDSVNLLDAQPVQEGFQLKFVESSKAEVLKGRLVDPDTLKGLPGIKLSIKLHPESFPEAGLRSLVIATVSTDGNGYFESESVPEGYYIISSEFSTINTAIPDGNFLRGDAKVRSRDRSITLLEKDVPVIYFAADGLGSYWKSLKQPVNGDPLPIGTVLRFKAKQNIQSNKRWNSDLSFNVTVKEEGLVKTPLVPEGLYTVSSVEGLPFSKDIWIQGLGSVHLLEKVDKAQSDAQIRD